MPGPTEAGVWGVEGLPSGSAMIGGQACTTPDRGLAGCTCPCGGPTSPNSDVFLDDVTVSRRHAEFRREHGQFQVCQQRQPQRRLCQPWTRWNRRCWPTATMFPDRQVPVWCSSPGPRRIDAERARRRRRRCPCYEPGSAIAAGGRGCRRRADQDAASEAERGG